MLQTVEKNGVSPVKALSIDGIGLSVRSANALHRIGVHSVGQMLEYTEESLMSIRNLGVKSVAEIVGKIEEYKELDRLGTLPFSPPGEEEEHERILSLLRERDVRIDVLELLSARAYNLLLFSGHESLHQIAYRSAEELLEIHRMDPVTAAEIERLTAHYIKENRERFLAESPPIKAETPSHAPEELFRAPENRENVLHFVRANDIELAHLGLSNRPLNRLRACGYRLLSDFIFITPEQLQALPAMGKGSVDEVMNAIRAYFAENEERLLSYLSGEHSELLEDDAVRRMVLNKYKELGFEGLSLQEMQEVIRFPVELTVGRLKRIIGGLLADGELEYVDYRCYRVYPRFEDRLVCSDLNERSLTIMRRRLQGDTLEAIAQDFGLTRERVRQILKKDIAKVRDKYTAETGMTFFDEDYYRYLYETYAFEKKDAAEWLGIPAYVWNYLDMSDVKQGKAELQTAMEDHRGLDAGMRLKIKNYLNRNRLFIDGVWVEKRRADLEQVVARKFCTENVSFDEYARSFNEFLEREGVAYDESIYYTEGVIRTRKNRLAESRFLLWKQNEQLRYYDIDGRDYTELFDTLNLDSLENIELSTLKFFNDYPELMEKYDIRDQYELHNLLRKTVPEGSFHDFRCGKMPIVSFGSFDRATALLDILIDNAPITQPEFIALVREQYGFDSGAMHLYEFDEFYHDGMYRIDQKPIPYENRKKLQAALAEDFYYIDEIRRIYGSLIPGADAEEINPFNLKSMGFSVYSRYALQNYPSLDAYFKDLLTREDVTDISAYRRRFVYVQMFSTKLMELKRSLQVIEFEPNKLISIRRLEASGVTLGMIRDFCDRVHDFVEDGAYFSASSLRLGGFESDLYELGFSDWFYANLLLSDDRFSYGIMFGTMILFKGKESITIKSFERSIVRNYGRIDVYDFMNELTDLYGCRISERLDIIYKLRGTEVYYDPILDRLYADKDLYYEELEKGD